MSHTYNGIFFICKGKSHAIDRKWMEHHVTVLSEINQTQKSKHCMFSHIGNLEKGGEKRNNMKIYRDPLRKGEY